MCRPRLAGLAAGVAVYFGVGSLIALKSGVPLDVYWAGGVITSGAGSEAVGSTMNWMVGAVQVATLLLK